MRNKKQLKHARKELFEHLSEQFVDLEGAITWYKKWRSEGQPGVAGFDCSLRVMASVCSDVLEDKIPGVVSPNYMETKFGSDIYWS